MIEANGRLNIKDIMFTPPNEKLGYFDYKKYLAFMNQSYVEELLGARISHNSNYLKNRFALKVLFPESKQPPFSVEELKEINDGIESQANTAYRLGVARRTALAAEIDPASLDKLVLLDKVRLRQDIKNDKERGNWSIAVENMASMSLLDRGVNCSTLDKEEADSLKRYFKKWSKDNMTGFIDMLAHARVSYPDREDIWNPDASIWQQINKYFSKIPAHGYKQHYLRTLSSAKILSAEKLHFTEKGLELTMPNNKLSENRKTIPESLKF
jgi:hypothetical protein